MVGLEPHPPKSATKAFVGSTSEVGGGGLGTVTATAQTGGVVATDSDLLERSTQGRRSPLENIDLETKSLVTSQVATHACGGEGSVPPLSGETRVEGEVVREMGAETAIPRRFTEDHIKKICLKAVILGSCMGVFAMSGFEMLVAGVRYSRTDCPAAYPDEDPKCELYLQYGGRFLAYSLVSCALCLLAAWPVASDRVWRVPRRGQS